MNQEAFLYPRLVAIFCFVIMIAVPFGFAPVQAADKLTITPSPLTFTDDKPQKLTIKSPSGDTLQGSNKFRVVSEGFTNNANKLIQFDPETLTITPLTSGQMTLKIEYKENEAATAIPGELKIVIPYKTVYLTEPFKKTPQGQIFKNDDVKLIGGQKYDVKSEGVDIKGRTVPVIADVSVSNNFVALKGNRTPTVLEAQGVNTSADSSLTLKVDDASYQNISIKVLESVDRIEVVINGTPQSGTASVSIPEGETLKLDASAVGGKGTKFPIQNDWIIQSTATNPRVTATVTDNKLVLATKELTSDIAAPPETITLRNNLGLSTSGQPAEISTTINVTVTPKSYYVELQASPGTILLPNARTIITGVVRRTRTNAAVESQPPVTFDLEEREKNKIWVNLTHSGNKATLTWREPTEAEIRNAYSGQLERRPSEVKVIATARIENKDFTSEIIIRMGSVEKFMPLRVKLNLMDDRTVSDLYGTVTSKDYYVLTVRLFNNLKDDTTHEYIGSSILAYSSSIEVAVNLEKKFNSNSDSYFPNVIKKSAAKRIADERSRAIATIAEADATALADTADQAKQTLKQALNQQYAAIKELVDKRSDAEAKATKYLQAKTPENQASLEEAIVVFRQARENARRALDNTYSVRAQIARSAMNQIDVPREVVLDANTAIDDGLWHPVTGADLERISELPPPKRLGSLFDDLPLLIEAEEAAANIPNDRAPEQIPEREPPCVGVIKYRPLTFEMVVNTVDRRDERSKRTRIFTILELVGTGTSFVTSVAVPGSSSDLPLGLEKYRNLLLPGLDKLFPSLKEQQRQNIVSQSMKEIEEIPFGSDITRVIFIPRKTIRGWIRGHDTRISEICPFYFSIEVAVIQKGRAVEQGAIVP